MCLLSRRTLNSATVETGYGQRPGDLEAWEIFQSYSGLDGFKFSGLGDSSEMIDEEPSPRFSKT